MHETNSQQEGQRICEILMKAAEAFSDIDGAALAGGESIALTLTHEVLVTDGEIALRFTPITDRQKTAVSPILAR